MAEMNLEKFVSELIRPILSKPDDLAVSTFSDEEDLVTIQVMVNSDDLGRVIGKKGRVANSIRTLAHVYGAKFGKKLEIKIDTFE